MLPWVQEQREELSWECCVMQEQVVEETSVEEPSLVEETLHDHDEALFMI